MASWTDWLRYAPLTVWGVGGVPIAAGAVYRTLNQMKIDPLELGVVKDLTRRLLQPFSGVGGADHGGAQLVELALRPA
ncbi:hypothetical protein FE391_07740 [Nonomuraea sp. KC401]|uniref:hypothetical protein n=1 Tax=unclassified Nonomuraea TaxID=2593643 RepID=UPI0010FEEC32|nr:MULTISPECIES: hypothetical protein [unclassified Nonomuraea]NBE93047.1 hypothetical protein [Nonomuraea sp. K271]TLF80391.1 hypothetical protein FE391_07740 [Nonomuraea sp. KC401]